jgi:hypothetical protein
VSTTVQSCENGSQGRVQFLSPAQLEFSCDSSPYGLVFSGAKRLSLSEDSTCLIVAFGGGSRVRDGKASKLYGNKCCKIMMV